MISRSLTLQILQAAKIMRRFFYEAPEEIMRIYTTNDIVFQLTHYGLIGHLGVHVHQYLAMESE